MSRQQKQKRQQHKRILIVGGGTAGWMAANLLVAQLEGVEVNLVESKDIGIIGVGEGSTPHLKLFFDAIGVSDQEWMPKCNATFKNGITFDGWSKQKGYESYFHPFAAQLDDIFTVPLFFKHIASRMEGFNVAAHPDDYFLETFLTQNNLGPLPAESFPFGVAYGYHFDSALLGQFLAKKAQSRGVKHLCGNVMDVALGAGGDVQSVTLEDGRVLEADIFVDCSGFQSLLLQKHLKVKFKSFKDNLFNDAAIVLPSAIDDDIPVETVSTALDHGWAWKIPLRNRFGNGYVYSTDYIDADRAETEFRHHLNLSDSRAEAKHLKMKVGRADKHWHKNCVAVGLSQGFIEPLEATAIALSFNTIAQFIQYYSKGGHTSQFQDAFNKDINGRFEGIRDYIVCHYKVNQRVDTQYWQNNANNQHISERLQHILHLWQHSKNFLADMTKYGLGGSYQPKSWACLLAGYGVFPPLHIQKQHDIRQSQLERDNVQDFIQRCGLNFKQHNDLLSA